MSTAFSMKQKITTHLCLLPTTIGERVCKAENRPFTFISVNLYVISNCISKADLQFRKFSWINIMVKFCKCFVHVHLTMLYITFSSKICWLFVLLSRNYININHKRHGYGRSSKKEFQEIYWRNSNIEHKVRWQILKYLIYNLLIWWYSVQK